MKHTEKIFLSFIWLALGIPMAVAAELYELFPSGTFDAGVQDMEIYRYPKFSGFEYPGAPAVWVQDGDAVLRLPGMPVGGYKLATKVLMMKPGVHGTFSVDVQADAVITSRIEIFQGGRRIAQDLSSLDIGRHRLTLSFITKALASGKGTAIPVRVVLWLSSQQDINVDNFAVRGDGDPAPAVAPVLTPDLVTGVYGIGEIGYMRVQPKISGAAARYRIRDGITGETIQEGRLTGDGRVPLVTRERGAFSVELMTGAALDGWVLAAHRMYAVIDRKSGDISSRFRFGIAMEEHGTRAMVDARLADGELYGLASEIGAGSVRLFTPAMPDMVSRDGIRYDFTFLDGVLKACARNGLEPLLELGANLPQRIPYWLKTSSSSSETIDLRQGLRTRKLRQKLEKAEGGVYLDLKHYRRYLRKVIAHVADRVDYYEAWNEPGHKFMAEDYARLLQVTREVQRELDPDARLVGFSSTKGKGMRGGGGVRPVPRFLARMIELNALQRVDILSYHSEHAFKYLGKGFDRRNDETGYAALLRSVLVREKRGDMPIWDTERGMAWTSPRKERADQWHGMKERQPGVHAVDTLEVARRLPLIHAAAQAEGVERLFWFYMDSSTATISKTRKRFGFFDAQLEPMPHLAVYDAMTEMLGGAEFARLIEQPSGLRAYLFSKGGATIVLVVNWKELSQIVKVSGAAHGFDVYDVMGNPVNDGQRRALNDKVAIDGWPRYLWIYGVDPEEVSIQ